MNKYLIGLIALMILSVAILFISNQSDSTNQTANTQESSSESTAVDDNSKKLLSFSEEALKQSTAEYRVIFFHADWCNVCNAVERNINAGVIPDNLDIFKIDFESSEGRELAEKYQIPIQYTSVLVDEDGNEIKKWVNLPSYGPQEFLDKIQES